MPQHNTAARLAALKRDKFGRVTTRPSSSGTPYMGDANAGPIGLTVELYLDGQGWVDISPYVYYRDRVKITRGRPDETSSVQPQTCTLTLNNRDSRFSPRNPSGPYYGMIGRNTPIRVSRMQNGARRYRFVGEVTSWPTNADISVTDVFEQLTAAGMLRRLNQGTAPVQSALYRAYTLTTIVPNVVAYWPCEDLANSTQIATAFPGGSVMTIAGSPKFANNSGFLSSNAIPTVNNSKWFGNVGTVSSWTDNVVRFLIQIPSGGDTDGATLFRFYTLGTVKRLDLIYNTASSGELTLKGFDNTGATLFTLGPFTQVGGFNGLLMRGSMALRTSGADVEYEFQSLVVGAGAAGSANGTLSSASIGAVTNVVVDPTGNTSGTAIGHISVQNVWDTLGDLIDALNAWNTDGPVQRLQRICQEENINQVTIGAFDLTQEALVVGSQTPDTFLALVQQCVDTDDGLLFEARDQAALSYRPRANLYNQGTSSQVIGNTLALDFAQNQLSTVPTPLDDDFYTRNDVTVSQIGGTSARQLLSDGSTLSISSPPTGVGTYATSYSLSLGNDGLIASLGVTSPVQATINDHAGWRLHLGTVDEPRYPQISVNLRHSTFQNSVDRMNAALTVDIGDVVEIDNPPSWLPPFNVRQIIQGYSETLGVFEHDIVFNCSPESPYRVFVPDDPVLARADTDGSTLASGYTSTDVSMSFATTTTGSPVWTVSGPDFPFDVSVGGERITVTSPGTNLSPDPLFSGGLSNWSASNSTIALSTAQPYTFPDTSAAGQPTISVTPDGASSSGGLNQSASTAVGSITPGHSYTVTGWVYATQSWSDVRMTVDWFDSSNVFLSTGLGSATSVSAGSWTPLTQTLTAPASSSRARVRFRWGSTPSSNITFYVYGLSMFDVATVNTASPQAFTVVRSRNGVVKPQAAGTDVRLWQPAILSL